MKDYSKEFRKKNRFIFELRYQPLLPVLDIKGKIIEEFHNKIKDKFPVWQLVNADILFTEKNEHPKNEFVIGLRRMSFIVEDIDTFESYYNNVVNFAKHFYSYFKNHSYERIGCRIISTYQNSRLKDFNGYLKLIEEKFLKDPLDLGLIHKDLFVKIDHSNGFYLLGPIKQKEPWIMSNFKDVKDEGKLPKYGLGLDIDSFGSTFTIKNERELIDKIDTTIKLSKSIEDALIKSLEL